MKRQVAGCIHYARKCLPKCFIRWKGLDLLTQLRKIAIEERCEITCDAHSSELLRPTCSYRPPNPRTPRRRWQGISNLNLALQIENASAFQLDAIVHQATNDLSA